MRYVIPAVLLVAAIIAGLVYLPEKLGEQPVATNESGTKLEADFVDLPPPEAPDYTTVVTDDALAKELTTEAEGYFDELSGRAGEALEGALDVDSPLLLSAESTVSWAGEEASVGELLARYGFETEAGELYYAHPVTATDSQGVWGIVQGGLSRLAGGIAERRGDSEKVYSALIPQNADERNLDGTSSFLGKVIWHKTMAAKVLNTDRGWARVSADVVVPGQDIVIVGFQRQELIAVYQYFAVEGS